MGGMLTHPVTDKRSNHGEGLGLRYGLSYMQGWRSEMEDAHDVQLGLKYGLDDWSYFAVFDGHAGKRAAAFASWNLLEFILRDTEFKLDTSHLSDYVCIEPDEEKLSELSGGSKSANAGISQSGYDFNGEPKIVNVNTPKSGQAKDPESDAKQENKLENRLTGTHQPDKPVERAAESISVDQRGQEGNKETPNNLVEPKLKPEFVTLPVSEQLKTVEKAIRSGFLRIDQSMRHGACDMSGCTAVCTFISPTHIFIANCGDSRAILYDGFRVRFASEDHKPLNPKERLRIIKAGGCATQRINGTLAVSRALGDFEFKKDQRRGQCEQLVSPEPEVTVITRYPKDMFLILACDGIWDVMLNYDLCEFVEKKLKVEKDLENVCSAVLDVCLHKGSRDNMSIIIVVFEGAPKFSEEALTQERANDETLRELVRKYGEPHDDFTEFLWRLQNCFRELSDPEKKFLDYLPPTIGLIAKYDMIHEIFEKEFEDKSDPKTDDE